MAEADIGSRIVIPVIRSKILGVDVVRGYARLCDLASVSRADIYDARLNPTGTQRDLSPKHARDAYLYIQQEEVSFWPEVFLALRRPEVCKLKATVPQKGFYELTIDVAAIRRSPSISISRVDGNHRLHFADGASDGYPPIKKLVSFCLAVEISKNDELKLFKEINDNQRRMNTSHLDNITLRVSEEVAVIRREPELYIAKRLMDDPDSPLSGSVFAGGKKEVARFIPLRTLKTGIEYMFSRPTRLNAVDDINVQVKLIKSYFSALKKWEPDAWKQPQAFLMARGAGLWGVCFLGAEIIDRVLARSKFGAEDMLKVLKSGRSWNWSKDGDFRGLSGRSGALEIRNKIVQDLVDDSGVSLKSLIKQISDS